MERLKKGEIILCCLFLITATLAVYLPSIGHDFIPLYDDTPYLLCNPSVQGFSWAHAKSAFTGFYCGNYAPLHIISYMLNYEISGLDPAGFILTNIVIHILNGVLIYFLLLRSTLAPRYAVLAAYLFLLHPVQVESVVWMSERKTVLSMFFFLSAFHLYISYLGGGSGKKYLFSLLCFVSALLSKSTALILPVCLICHDDVYRKQGSRATRVKDKIPFLLIALAAACMTLYSQESSRFGGRTEYHGGSPLATFFTMLPVLLKYLRNIFYPVGLTVFYGDLAAKPFFDEEVFLSALVALFLLFLGFYLLRRNRELFCWYALFFVGLLPVSQIVPIVTLINDRYLYFPMVGAAGFLAVVLRLIRQKYEKAGRPVAVVTVLICLLLPWSTYLQAKTWRNSFSLYKQIILQNRERIDFKILNDQNFLQGDADGLLALSEKLQGNFPSSPDVLRFAATVSLRVNNPYAAQLSLEKLCAITPNDLESLLLLASVYKNTGQTAAARNLYEQILRSNPESETARRAVREME